jgi:preprotein translocase subunit SecB
MNDPNKQPGYAFSGIRLIDAAYSLVKQPEPGRPLTLDIDFADRIMALEPTIQIRQKVEVTLVDSADNGEVCIRVRAEIEGVFQPIGEVNIPPMEFASNQAAVILFPFLREWIHRLTSETGVVPPLLLPPINVLLMRRAREEQLTATRDSKRKGKRKK